MNRNKADCHKSCAAMYFNFKPSKIAKYFSTVAALDSTKWGGCSFEKKILRGQWFPTTKLVATPILWGRHI